MVMSGMRCAHRVSLPPACVRPEPVRAPTSVGRPPIPEVGPTPLSGRSRPCPTRLSRRVAAIAESATLAVDAKAKALKAAGEPVIGFGAGEPDFPTPDHIVEAAVAAVPRPRNHRYTPGRPACPSCGRPSPAKTGATPATRSPPARCWSPTAASTPSTTTFEALLDPGDEVLLPAPYWTTYPEPIAPRRRRAGRAAHRREHRASGSPSTSSRRPAPPAPRRWSSCRRPTRRAPSTRADEVRAIGEWAVEHGIWVITDEIYEHLTYGDHEFPSMPTLVPELADTLRGAQRRGQDLRHDGLAGRVDDRPDRRRQGGDQPPVARHVERGQRVPAGRARRRRAAT